MKIRPPNFVLFWVFHPNQQTISYFCNHTYFCILDFFCGWFLGLSRSLLVGFAQSKSFTTLPRNNPRHLFWQKCVFLVFFFFAGSNLLVQWSNSLSSTSMLRLGSLPALQWLYQREGAFYIFFYAVRCFLYIFSYIKWRRCFFLR